MDGGGSVADGASAAVGVERRVFWQGGLAELRLRLDRTKQLTAALHNTLDDAFRYRHPII